MHLTAATLLLILAAILEAVDSFVSHRIIPSSTPHHQRQHLTRNTVDASFHRRRSLPLSPHRVDSFTKKLRLTSDSNENVELLNLSLEEKRESLEYLASLIRTRLNTQKVSDDDSSQRDDMTAMASSLAESRFVDLTTRRSSQRLLEGLFLQTPQSSSTSSSTSQVSASQIKYAIKALQSLLIYGMQIGVKGSEEQQQKLVRHLYRRTDAVRTARPSQTTNNSDDDDDNGDSNNGNGNGDGDGDMIEWVSQWTAEDIRRLKYRRDTALGKSLLAALKKRQSAIGAYELLVEMGVWDADEEELGLLRSGFPVEFWEEERRCSFEVSERRIYFVIDVLCMFGFA